MCHRLEVHSFDVTRGIRVKKEADSRLNLDRDIWYAFGTTL